jgi:hypothetical protein
MLLKKSRLLALDPALKRAAIRPVVSDCQQRVGCSDPFRKASAGEDDFLNSIDSL